MTDIKKILAVLAGLVLIAGTFAHAGTLVFDFDGATPTQNLEVGAVDGDAVNGEFMPNTVYGGNAGFFATLTQTGACSTLTMPRSRKARRQALGIRSSRSDRGPGLERQPRWE